MSKIPDSPDDRKCGICSRRLREDDRTNLHHSPVPRSAGGEAVVAVHERCHREHHSGNGDFRRWGQLSAVTRAWAFNLKNVRTHPAYEMDRSYYLMFYAH
jgi:hypothetical protein